MKLSTTSLLFVLTSCTTAQSVVGTAQGFATGVTGGGTAPKVTPTSTAQLVSYLGDSTARVIVLDRTFNFIGTEGRTTATGCAPYGTASNCQVAINKDDCKQAASFMSSNRSSTYRKIRVYQLSSLCSESFSKLRQRSPEPHSG